MKKKLLFAVATGLFAITTVFNMNLLQVDSNGDVLLESIAVMAQAHTEGGGDDYVWFEKLEAVPIHGDVYEVNAGIRIWVNPGASVPVGFTLIKKNDVIGHSINCEFFAFAKCDQSKVGVFYKPL